MRRWSREDNHRTQGVWIGPIRVSTKAQKGRCAVGESPRKFNRTTHPLRYPLSLRAFRSAGKDEKSIQPRVAAAAMFEWREGVTGKGILKWGVRVSSKSEDRGRCRIKKCVKGSAIAAIPRGVRFPLGVIIAFNTKSK
uniref:Uncharacterized protein n=1 Tax=Trieres chinensis TaxID=1514140 RepID=A0A7S1ZX38_TRICV